LALVGRLARFVTRKTILAVAVIVISFVGIDAVMTAVVGAEGPHARGHLASANAALHLIPVLAVVLWALPPDRRKGPEWTTVLVLVVAVIVAGIAVDVAGNPRVVDAIGDSAWNDTQVEALGPSRLGFESGHDLAGQGMWIIVAGAIALALVMIAVRAVRPLTGAASCALSLVFPPWIAPGFGIVVVTVAGLRARNRRDQAAAAPAAVARRQES
jgi:type IV secretory pathway TrbD component